MEDDDLKLDTTHPGYKRLMDDITATDGPEPAAPPTIQDRWQWHAWLFWLVYCGAVGVACLGVVL